MDWITFGTSTFASLSTAILVSYLGPKFQHLSWKKQKKRETCLFLANRLIELAADADVAVLAPRNPANSFPKALEYELLLALTSVVLERKEGRGTALDIKKLMNQPQADPGQVLEAYRRIYGLRLNLLILLYSEAFDIPLSKLQKRAQEF